ncbi:phosphatase PAP2 family protein [Luteolibacter ambystomatis]|uniref:Phosphatase PAP2 family protein n=1 Tax=Luteolibacter ambystomatis TaxID=2824561 RepID=A0A975G7N3_9BACT|nr:phosphatase PAP2 family protein [Luteolibacter ambystomatis]QUE50318.1 phosphatase PAP2 family protein [Luteolibacter ambystomatis]
MDTIDPPEPDLLASAVPIPGVFAPERPVVRTSAYRRFRRDVLREWRGLVEEWTSGSLKQWTLAGVVVSLLMMWKVDGPWLQGILTHLRSCPPPEALGTINFCRWVNVAGDFGFSLLIFVILSAIHSVKRSPFIRRLAVSVLVSSLVVGAAARVVKIGVGRVRPREMTRQHLQPWSCVGPALDANYNSFPSGHSSFAAAGSGPVLMAAPWAGIPLTACTLVIGGSRAVGMYHHPSDVVAGIWLGAMIGCTSGMRLRRLTQRARRIAACRAA